MPGGIFSSTGDNAKPPLASTEPPPRGAAAVSPALEKPGARPGRQARRAGGKTRASDALWSPLAQNINLSARHRLSGDGKVQTIVEKNRDRLMQTIQDIDPEETREWLDSLEAVIDAEGVDRAHFLLEQSDHHGTPARHVPALQCEHAVPQHDSRRSPAALPGRSRNRAAHQLDHPLERARDGGARQPATPPSSAAISRASSPPRPSTTSASAISGARRPRHHGGDIIYIQGHSSPGIYARAFVEGRLTEQQMLNFRREVDGQRTLVLSASVADAGLLAVPDRVDGPRTDHGDLPGALHEVSRGARPRPRRATARSGPSWATARWTSRNRSAQSRSPRARSSTT